MAHNKVFGICENKCLVELKLSNAIKLWENNNYPNIDFPAREVTLTDDISNYDFFFWTAFRNYEVSGSSFSQQPQLSSGLIPVNKNKLTISKINGFDFVSITVGQEALMFSSRTVSVFRNKAIFTIGSNFQWTFLVTDERYYNKESPRVCVPLAIYGIKDF